MSHQPSVNQAMLDKLAQARRDLEGIVMDDVSATRDKVQFRVQGLGLKV
jgi:hypothetical protein